MTFFNTITRFVFLGVMGEIKYINKFINLTKS